MSLPFFETLRPCFPDSQVDIIAKDRIQDVFLHHPAIHAIHPFSKASIKGLRGLYNYGKALQKHGPYDLFLTLPKSFSSALIGYGVGSRIRAGYKATGRNFLLTHSVHAEHGIHRVHVYRHLLRSVQETIGTGLERMPPDDSVRRIMFHFSEEERRTAVLSKQPPFKDVVLNVNSEAQSRRLPIETWVALGNKLLKEQRSRINLVFMGAPGEEHRVEEVIRQLDFQDQILNVCGKTSVRELAMLLRDADVLVTNDSGPMHLANAVGTPLVTFFGAGNPLETGPFTQERAIVLNKRLPCSPCVKNRCRFHTVRCLEQITVEEIYQSVITLLNWLK